ncbi:hypothetical protein GCM10011386_20420 [Parapedobacter defluvii]|uniref:Uncharacterized protein n=1 Tax=Parapedobacter defluvii TaxID=2045106 RepID=A0ABQ1LUB7_9SPHI|nr:hypothetical protein [Parapedobacter defluvii]GGC28300.1 hypothetical protein GCM10011386_20420 [Parapedobacter defluvii]
MKYVDKEDITRKHDLTIEEVKSLPMFSHFTDEQAEEAIRTIKTFVEIALEYHKKEKENHGEMTDF